MRSPYCYLALDRILDLRAKYDVQADLRNLWALSDQVQDARLYRLSDVSAYGTELVLV